MRQITESFRTTSRLRVGMGTFIAVEADTRGGVHELPAIEAAFAAIAKVEALMHPSRSGSDLLAIHDAALGVPVPVHAWTWEVLALSKRLNHASQGVFDPCLPEARGRLADLEFAAPHSVIAHAPLHLDLGGIAKGFAVDRALAALQAAGCDGGLVNAGGDLAVFGDRGHSISYTTSEGDQRRMQLKNSALASSDAGNASRPVEHRGYYHGLDGCETNLGSVTVMAASAAVADGLTKCLLAGHTGMNAALLDTFGALLIADTKPLFADPGTRGSSDRPSAPSSVSRRIPW